VINKHKENSQSSQKKERETKIIGQVGFTSSSKMGRSQRWASVNATIITFQRLTTS